MTLRRHVVHGLTGLAVLSTLSCAVGPGSMRVERGIGGTGGPSLADRGIGGTGGTAIVGAITGFGSVFVNGFEIENARVGTIQVDGEPAPISALRVGQVARLIARPIAGGLIADAIAIEHEVIGPVERFAADGSFVVAGQRIRPLPGVRGDIPVVGRSLAVSGFRSPAGEILASRLDNAAKGETLLTGKLVQAGGGSRIGGAVILGARRMDLAGMRVRIRGQLSGRTLIATSVVPAPLLELRPGLDRAVLQTITAPEAGGLQLGETLDARRGPALPNVPENQPVIIMLLANPDGSLTATGIVDDGRGGESASQAGALEAAPAGSTPASAASSAAPASGTQTGGRGGGGSGGGSGGGGRG